jgi:solute carrier family 45 protein 1/2/4
MFIFFMGSMRLPDWLGNTQFKAMSFIVSGVLIVVVFITLLNTDENAKPVLEIEQSSRISIFKTLYAGVRNMPPRTWQVCKIQCFTWLGWFPFLYYNIA